MLKTQLKAPEFEALDQNGINHRLSDYLGKWVVFYFYPKDDTPGCTKEACNFRDSFHQLESMGAVLLGVSKDTVKSHKKFADKYQLNFPILSDESLSIIKKYEAWGSKKFMGKEYDGIFRITYLINPEGVIEKSYDKVNPLVHAGEIIKDLKNMK